MKLTDMLILGGGGGTERPADGTERTRQTADGLRLPLPPDYDAARRRRKGDSDGRCK